MCIYFLHDHLRQVLYLLQDLIKLKDTQVEDLRYEAARLRKAHDDLLATYEAKLAKLGVPIEELGFKYVFFIYSAIQQLV